MASDTESLNRLVQKYQRLRQEIGKVIIGQDKAVESLLLSVFTGGHCLLVGVPGLAKTLMVNTLSKALGLKFSRIQFTPDLMPSDITGTEILDENRKFRFVKGPIFANILLADEINRTPPKTQAALLEAMQEKSVTVSGHSYPLDSPFFVLATQNPIEQEGTYPLPEAQLDRFMLNIKMDYPSFDEEMDIVKRTTVDMNGELEVVLSAEEILEYQSVIRRMPVPDNVVSYAVSLVAATRPDNEGNQLAHKYLSWGAGPRASQYLIMGAKTNAALNGKFSPDREDVDAVATEVLRHRLVRNYFAEAEGISTDSVISELKNSVK
ncbi:MAG: MoxR family ATPase [Bacteroidales bacterium]|jgi:MoxR-like ATPase|nr:MoxR family ATPase [Bacteroidales bacterium]MBR4176092.1 MoxR family ATPase [Bacteroidales bacterium]